MKIATNPLALARKRADQSYRRARIAYAAQYSDRGDENKDAIALEAFLAARAALAEYRAAAAAAWQVRAAAEAARKADAAENSGTLYDYKTGAVLRPASDDETATSRAAGKEGVISVNGRSCYVSQ